MFLIKQKRNKLEINTPTLSVSLKLLLSLLLILFFTIITYFIYYLLTIII